MYSTLIFIQPVYALVNELLRLCPSLDVILPKLHGILAEDCSKSRFAQNIVKAVKRHTLAGEVVSRWLRKT